MKGILVPIAALLLAAPALAQGPRFGDAPRSRTTSPTEQSELDWCGRHRPGRGDVSMRGLVEGQADLRAEGRCLRRAANASIVSIAADREMDIETLRAACQQARTDAIASLLEAGEISEPQAEWMRERGAEVSEPLDGRRAQGAVGAALDDQRPEDLETRRGATGSAGRRHRAP